MWTGGIFLGNWNLERLSISHFLRTASITENIVKEDVRFHRILGFGPTKKIHVATSLRV